MLGFRHPDSRYEFHLRNLDMTPGILHPLMEVFLIYESEHAENDFTGAVEIGGGHLDDLLALMTVVTASRFEVHRRVCIADWRTGVSERKGMIFKNFGHPDIPQAILGEAFAEVLFLLQHSKDHGGVRRALHWFSGGIAASHAEDQFEFFWFAIETLAVAFKDVALVPDRCSACRSPLHCESCHRTTVHRPYAKQAIEQLIVRLAPKAGIDGQLVFEKGSELRNTLQHGDNVEETEERIGWTVRALVDPIAKIARLAVLDGLARTSTLRQNFTFRWIEPTTFLHYRLQTSVVIGMPCSPDKPPHLDDFKTSGFKLDMLIGEQTPQDPPPEGANLPEGAEEG